jgi:hypothetical protein
MEIRNGEQKMASRGTSSARRSCDLTAWFQRGGPRGEPAPAITGRRVDRASYTAVPVLSDGSVGSAVRFSLVRDGLAG